MLFKNTEYQYGLVTIFLHWLIAIIVIGLLSIGLYMVDLPISLQKLKYYGWHKEFGILVLILVIVRLAWRLSNVTPALPEHMPAYEKVGARSVHFAFYIFLFAMPITGWMMSSAAGLPVSFFGLFVLPDLVNADPALMGNLQDIHKWLGYGLIVTVCLHAGAALQHHFFYRDDILRRMLWP